MEISANFFTEILGFFLISMQLLHWFCDILLSIWNLFFLFVKWTLVMFLSLAIIRVIGNTFFVLETSVFSSSSKWVLILLPHVWVPALKNCLVNKYVFFLLWRFSTYKNFFYNSTKDFFYTKIFQMLTFYCVCFILSFQSM